MRSERFGAGCGVSFYLLAGIWATWGLAGCGGSTDENGGGGGGSALAPSATIERPADGAVLPAGVPVVLTGSVSSPVAAPAELTVVWTSDRRETPLFEGPPNSLGSSTVEIDDLEPGAHVITLGAVDASGRVGTARVNVVVNRPPGAPVVSVSPVAPRTGDNLVASVTTPASDAEQAPEVLTYTFQWYRDGELHLTGATVPSDLTSAGERWEVRVAANDGLVVGEAGVASVTIGNTAPACEQVVILPTAVRTTDSVTCSCARRVDPDGDAPADRCAFYEGANLLPGDGACTLSSTYTRRGTSVRCTLTPADGEDDGVPVESQEVLVVNSPPTAPVAAVAPENAHALTRLTCSLTTPAEDADADSIVYSTAWAVNGHGDAVATGTSVVAGALVGADGTTARRGDHITCTLKANDGVVDSAAGSSPPVILGNAPPVFGTVAIGVAGDGSATALTALSCDETGLTDADGDALTLTYEWFVDGESVVGQTGRVLPPGQATRGQSVTCKVTADDGHGAVVTSAFAKDPVVLANSPPSLAGAVISPATGSPYDTFTCDPVAWYDADGDLLEASYAWYRAASGALELIGGVTTRNITPDTLVAGDGLVCEVTPRNGALAGAPVRSEPATITAPGPRAPAVSLTAPDGASGAARCDFTRLAENFAGSVSYAYHWSKNGGAEFSGGPTLGGLGDCDALTCRVVATDGVTTLSSNTAAYQLPVGEDCETGDACRPATCAVGGGCDVLLASDIPCDDGNDCTTGDTCELGFCLPSGFADSGAACEDGRFCTSDDTCDGAGTCREGGSSCGTDAGGCLATSCNEFDRSCLASPKPANTPCNDGNGCTTGDVCTANGVCLPGSPRDCSGADAACAVGVCESLGPNDYTCTTEPRPAGATCDDGRFCTVDTTCTADGVCAGGAPRDCAAEVGDACNTGSCDAIAGRCVRSPRPTGAACEDGDVCTILDSCSNGACIGGQDACVEEQVNDVVAGDQRPAIVSLGFGRFAIQWWATAAPGVALRLLDARGGRENEEIHLESRGRPPAWSTRMATRAGGDFAFSRYDASHVATCSKSYSNNYNCTDDEPGWLRGHAFDFTGAQRVATEMVSARLRVGWGNTYGVRTPTCTLNPARFATLNLDGAFATVTSVSNAYSDHYSTWLVPFGDGGTTVEAVLTTRSVRLYPPTGLMTVGPSVVLVPHTDIWGIAWDAREATDGLGGFHVAWVGADRSQVFVRRFQSSGVPAPGSTAPQVVHTVEAGQLLEAVRVLPTADSRLVVAWQLSPSGSGADADVFVRRYDEELNPLGSAPVRVNASTTGQQRLGEIDRFSNDDFVVTYDDEFGDGDGWAVKARLYQANVTPKGNVIAVNRTMAGAQTQPTVAVLDTDEWVVGFVDDGGRVWTRRFQADGSASIGQLEWRLNMTTDGVQRRVRATAAEDGTALAVFESPVVGRAEGEILGRLVYPTGHVSHPGVGVEFMANSTTAGAQLRPAVAAGGGRFGVVWDSAGQDGAAEAVVLRYFDLDGAAITAEQVVNTTTAGYQRSAAVAMNAFGETIVAWTGQSSVQGSTADIFARIYDADGTALTGELLVNTTLAGLQDGAAVAIDDDGNAVVVWQSMGGDGSGFGIMARRFSLDGEALTDEVQVNTWVDLDQRRPSVTLMASGDLMACWESYGQDLEGSLGIVCQALDGETLGRIAQEVVVNRLAAGEQRNPMVAAHPSGGVLVAWDSEGVDGDAFGVHLQRLDDDGVHVGPRVLVNRDPAGSQEGPSTIVLGASQAVVFWESTTPLGGGDKDIFFRLIQNP